MDNPYAPPEAEVVEKNTKPEINDKEVLYKKYRDEVKSFAILSLCSTFFLLPGFHFVLFIASLVFCIGGVAYSWQKMTVAKKDYLEDLEK